MSNAVSQPSQPGFGYLLISRAQRAEFTPLGRNYYLSCLDEADTAHMLDREICVWLGPGEPHSSIHFNLPLLSLKDPSQEDDSVIMSAYFIHPGHGIFQVGQE